MNNFIVAVALIIAGIAIGLSLHNGILKHGCLDAGLTKQQCDEWNKA